jgi:predicted MFS family arabinose efflux permease
MRPAPAAPDATSTGWGSSALRRATLTLAIAQLVSWGVLFYGFAVTAPAISADTGWSDGVVSGAFALGLLISGFGAPPIARALARHDPRRVLTTGSIVGMIGMLAFAAAPNPPVLYLAWIVIGAAMAATLYEPAMAVLVALDPARRHRTLAVVTVAGGLASTVFAPLAGWLVDALGWRQALAVLGISGGVVTAVLHAIVLPSAGAHHIETQVAHVPAPPLDRPLRLMRSAVLFEQAAMIATTAYLISMLVDRGVDLTVAAAALGVMGLGKVAGRLLLLGPVGRRSLTALAAICSAVQLAGLALPLGVTGNAVLFPAMFVVGCASGATTVLRPLIVVELVGAAPFAATNARIQRASTVARAAAPLVLGATATALGWPVAWAGCLVAFAIAGERYVALGRSVRPVGS